MNSSIDYSKNPAKTNYRILDSLSRSVKRFTPEERAALRWAVKLIKLDYELMQYLWYAVYPFKQVRKHLFGANRL